MNKSKLFLFVPALFLLGGLSSCNPGSSPTLSSITAKLKEGKAKGSTLTCNDITVTATKSDNSSTEITYNYTKSDSYRVSYENELLNLSADKGYIFTEAKTYNFTVIYSNISTVLTVTVA